MTFPAKVDPTRCAREAVARLAGAVHEGAMRSRPIVALLLVAAAPVPPLPPGRWDATSKIVEFTAPGVPGFVATLAHGKSRAEHKWLRAGEGVEALLLPEAKARCRVESQTVRDGRYAQTLSCPRKDGSPLRIGRSGTFDTAGFVERATVTGTTAKGAVRIVLDQRAARVVS